MVEDGPNPVTPQGLAQIDGHIARIESAMQGEDNALLRETLARQSFDHNLTLKVWANTDDRMTPAEVKTALLTKAAHILKRTVTVAELPVDAAGNIGKATLDG